MDDLAHPQVAAEANDVADDLSTGTAAIEAENTDAQNLYADDKPIEEVPQDGELDDEGDDADGEPIEDIAAPVGLKPEEKEKYAQLPPEAQRTLSEILDRRNIDAQKGVQAAISAQREAERSAADQVATSQQQFAAQFQQLVQAFAPTPPSAELAAENPAAYIAQKAQFDEEARIYSGLIEQITGLQGQSSTHFEERKAEWFGDQVRQLKSIPEYADEATRQQFLGDVKAVGLDLGYPEDVLNSADAKDIFALNKARVWKAKAEKWDAHQRKRNERPRVAGRFTAAPAGNGAASAGTVNDALKALYPND